MKLIVISIISSILAGMGIGGGALFVLLATNFLQISQINAQALNLILFLATGIGATISNLKNKKIDLIILKKIWLFLIIGSVVGTFLITKMEENNLRKYFSVFLLIIGIYEIISSVISIIKAKNINNEIKERRDES